MVAQITNALSADKLINIVRGSFNQIPDISKNESSFSLTDFLMSGFSLFNLKYPSLLQFDSDRKMDPIHAENLKVLYGIENIPCDTHIRERLDEQDPNELRDCYKKLFSAAQRHKVLEDFTFLNGYYLLSPDGTGFFSSKNVHCENCCEKHHRDGTTTYYHQMYCAAIVHPDMSQVIPLCPEPILKQDGTRKNDCERNAAKRMLVDLKREHPHMKFILTEDALGSNAPHIRLIMDLGYRYIIGVKPGDHAYLFKWVKDNGCSVYEYIDEQQRRHRYEYINNVPLNETNQNVKVNFISYQGYDKKGRSVHFTKITDFPLNDENVELIMTGGRARWKIENETFNTLKNQGYQFEHNFGHGHKHLSTIFSRLMVLAFFVDQLQAIGCPLFKLVKEKFTSLTHVWHKTRVLFDGYIITSFRDIYEALANGFNRAKLGDLLNDSS